LAQASNVEDAHVVATEQHSIKEAKLPMPIRSHSYNVFTDRQTCNAFLDCPYQKLSPSHNQLLNLVAHCLDQKDIPLFLSIYNSVKYHHPPDTTKTIPAFETTCPPFVNPKIKEYFGNLCICKTLAWAVAHLLERVSMNGKNIDCIHVMLMNLVLLPIMRI